MNTTKPFERVFTVHIAGKSPATAWYSNFAGAAGAAEELHANFFAPAESISIWCKQLTESGEWVDFQCGEFYEYRVRRIVTLP